MQLLRLLQAARWLSTSQVHRRFFQNATMNAARRRLRRLAAHGYVRKHQTDRMQEALFTLGREGKRLLEQAGATEIELERQPPKQLEHLAGINDIRIAAETAGQLAYCFAAWELQGLGWKCPIVPDAVFRLAERTFAVEYDRGGEGLRYFTGTKITWYQRGLPGFPITSVLIVVDRQTRMRTLARAIRDDRGQFLFTTIDAIRSEGLLAPIFHRNGIEGQALPPCSLELSRREDSLCDATDYDSMTYENAGVPS